MKGFTLIELIAVIVILGVLSVVAAPKFISVRTDATIATLQGMKGAMESASSLVHIKAQLSNQLSGSDTLDLGDGTSINIHSGYATAHWNNSIRFLINLDNVSYTNGGVVCTSDWCGRGNQTSLDTDDNIVVSGYGSKIWPRGYEWSDKCAVHYINNEDGTAPIIGISTSDC